MLEVQAPVMKDDNSGRVQASGARRLPGPVHRHLTDPCKQMAQSLLKGIGHRHTSCLQFAA